MSQPQLLKQVVEALDRAGVPYMVTESVASSLQGEPRATHDIDIVVALPDSAAGELLKAFPSPAYYLDESSMLGAIRAHSVFNLLHIDEGDKVDFWLLTEEPFDQSRFSRRSLQKVMALQLAVSQPEDTILAKLRWAKLAGGSEKQFGDALRVYEVQAEKLDLGYLSHWARILDVQELWTRIQAEAKGL
jgi:hypothetical protein